MGLDPAVAGVTEDGNTGVICVVRSQFNYLEADVSEKAFLNWAEIHSAARLIYEALRPSFIPTAILAITRGGLIPAGLFAYLFDVKKRSLWWV
jgi:hypothetical protein